ncbi:MAG: AraC family transcriptional regulator, partial [Eubacteriales bacterium]|nr:AraC family transcriptional regulator [Eubacteriales bacterium]
SALFQKEDTPFRQDIPAFCLDDQELLRTGDSIGIVRQGRYDPVGRHTHTYLELAYVWSGESVQWIEGERLPMRRGDICLMDPEVEHAVEACGREDTVVNLVMPQRLFDYTFLSKMGEQSILSRFLLNAVTKQRNRKHYLYFPTSGNERAAWLMETLLLEYYERDLGWREAMDSYLLLLFTEMLRSFRAGGGQEESGTGASVQEILAYIETNYRDCTLSQAAAQFSFHPVYLTTMLKEKTGRGFLEHLQSQRLHMACYLLLHTDMKIAEIAEEVGYSNLDFFYRKFKAAQGCTPRAFRELSK